MIILLWLLSAIACAIIASSKSRSGLGWFFAGVAFGFFALFIVIFLPRGGRIPCPRCAEMILPAARICPHCGRDRAWVQP